MTPTPLQIISYFVGAVLLASVWKYPRLRTYAALTLGADVLRALLQLSSSKHYALYLADAALASAALCVVPWALRLDAVAVGLFAAALVVPIADAGRRGTDNGWRIYTVASLVVHLYSCGAAGWLCARVRRVRPAEGILLALCATGASGAVLALAWRDWDVVCAGNIVAGCVVAGATGVLGERLDEQR